MKKYIGTKIVKATKMLEEDFRECNQGVLETEGYKVEYEDGYISWSPKEVFEEAYRETNGLTFGLAIEALKKGHKVARKGWNGKGMWIVLMSGLKLPSFNSQAKGAKVNDRTAKWIGEDTPLDSQPYIAMWTASKQWQPGWLASQADMLADDWQIVE